MRRFFSGYNKFILISSLFLFFIGISIFFSGSFAATLLYSFETEEQSKSFAQLLEQFRCLVCQNKTLADSNAPLALDLKNQIYERLKRGESKQEITEYLKARYGEFVLMQPSLSWKTTILWIAPILFLLLGFALVFAPNYLRNNR